MKIFFFSLYIWLEAGLGLTMSYMKDILCTWNYLSVNFKMFTIWCLAMLILKFKSCDSEVDECFGIFIKFFFFLRNVYKVFF